MLSDASRPVVEATLPAVGANIGEITKRFYPHMFAAHPELLDGMFNRGNQARGEQQQALAGSVAAFATALVETPPRTPESLLPADRPQARVAGHQRRPVPDRARQPDVGDRRRPRRRRHPGGRGRLGRGLLADGERADQPGARPLQRARRATRRPCGGRGRWRARSARPPTSSPSSSAASTTGWSRPRCPASTSPSRSSCPTASTSPASTASPAPTTASTGSSRSSGSATRASRTARSPPCCTTPSTSATS